ncbi:MAG: oxidoreductase, partial [Ginsengibacter sp.]
MKKLLYTFFLFFFFQNSFAQKIEILSESGHASFRGLSVVSNDVMWVSGSNGTVGKSINGGKSWKWIVVKGFEKTDFRDIEAFDKKTALIMAVDEPAYILRTNDGGDNWKIVFENKTKGMFLDAMEFWNDQSGIVIGDPINHLFYIGRTFDGGKTWQ